MKKYSMTISNIITVSRLVLLPIIIYFILTGDRFTAFVIMLISLLSDGLDGYLARKLHQESKLGRFLDPLCDKVFLAVILVTLLYVHAIPLWIVIVIVLRDFLILLGSYFLMKMKSVIEPSNILGKITGLIFGAMILAFTAGWKTVGSVLVYLSIPFMLVAFIIYTLNYLKIMRGAS